MASCGAGDHRMYWTIEADDVDEALGQLPPYLAERTHASEVKDVMIR